MSMVRQFLSTYTVRVRKAWGREDLDFSEVPNEPAAAKDIFEIFSEFIATLEAADIDDPNDQTLIGAKQVKYEPGKRHIYGMLESGPYGEEGNLKNTRTRASRKIKAEEATTYPYYFNLFLPGVGTRGLFAIHSRGKYGCKTPFHKALMEFVRQKYPGMRIFLNPFEVDFKENFKFFKHGLQVRKVRAVTFKKLRVQDALIRGRSAEERQVTVERVVHVGRSEDSLFDPAALKASNKAVKATLKTFKHYAELPAEADSTKYQVTVKLGGQEKTMELNQSLDFHLSFDLTGDLVGYSRAVPTLNKLHDVCGRYIEHAISELG